MTRDIAKLSRILQANPDTRSTPIIFLSAADDKSFVIEALQHGGVDYVTKPFNGAELLTRVDPHSKLDAIKSRIHTKPVSLKENATKAVKNFGQHLRSKGIRLAFHTPPGNLMVPGEERTLLCCLENLISNAIKFSPQGSHVIIGVQPDGPTGEFRIEDEGPGIQADEVGNLFQKFTRLSAKPTAGESSTGLGLHIVYELVCAMRGTVEYEKSQRGGACFKVRFPLAS